MIAIGNYIGRPLGDDFTPPPSLVYAYRFYEAQNTTYIPLVF